MKLSIEFTAEDQPSYVIQSQSYSDLEVGIQLEVHVPPGYTGATLRWQPEPNDIASPEDD